MTLLVMAPRLLTVLACDGKEGLRNVAGANAISLKRGIDKATHFSRQIAEHARPVEDSAIAQVGSISSGNDDEVGRMIADAMERWARRRDFLEGKSMTTELEITEGMRFDKGYISLLPIQSGWRRFWMNLSSC